MINLWSFNCSSNRTETQRRGCMEVKKEKRKKGGALGVEGGCTDRLMSSVPSSQSEQSVQQGEGERRQSSEGCVL